MRVWTGVMVCKCSRAAPQPRPRPAAAAAFVCDFWRAAKTEDLRLVSAVPKHNPSLLPEAGAELPVLINSIFMFSRGGALTALLRRQTQMANLIPKWDNERGSKASNAAQGQSGDTNKRRAH